MKPKMQSFETDWAAAAVAMHAVDLTAKPDAVAVIVRSKVSDGEAALALAFPTPSSLTDFFLASLMMMGDKVWASGGRVRSPEEIARALVEARARAREVSRAAPPQHRRPVLRRARPK